MTDDNAEQVNVAISGQVDGFTSAANTAQAGFQGIRMSAQDARTALQAAGGDWNKMASAMLATETAAKASASGTAAAGAAAAAATVQTAHLSAATSGAIQEYVRLGHEAMIGSFSRMPGSLVVLASRMGGLQTIMGAVFSTTGAVAGAFLALGAALAYVVVHAIEAENAIDKIQMGAEFAGNVALTREQIEGLTKDMSALGVSRSDGDKILELFSRLRDESTPELQALVAEVHDYAQVTGQTAVKASEQLAKAFADPTKNAVKFVETLGGATQAQIDAAQKAEDMGNANQAASVMIQALDTALQRARPTMDTHNEQVTASAGNWFTYASAIEQGYDAEQAETEAIDAQNRMRTKQIDLIKQATSAMGGQPMSSAQTLRLGVTAAEKEDRLAEQVQKVQGDVDQITAALVVAKDTGDQVNVDRLTAGLQSAKQHLDELKFGPVMEQARAEIAATAASWDGTESGLLTKENEVWSRYLAQVRAGSKEAVQIQTEMDRNTATIHKSSGDEMVTQTRDQIAAINAQTNIGEVEKLTQEKSAWASLLTSEQLTYQQRLAVEREYHSASAALTRAEMTQQEAVEKSDADTAIEIRRIQLQQEKEILTQEAQAHKITAAQEFDQLKTLAKQEEALDEEALQNRLATLKNQPAQYEEVYNQILVLRAKLSAQLASYDKQEQMSTQRETRSDVQFWKGAVSEITSAEDTMVRDIFSKRTNLSQSLIAMAQQLVEREIAADLKYLTMHELYSMLGLATDKSVEQSGILVHLAAELTKTQATATGVAARSATVTAGAAADAATEATETKGSVLKHAASAAAAVYDDVAQIPYVGWILAPPAAAAAFAAVAAFGSFVSAEGGMWDTGGSAGLLMYHPKETILPASVAEPMRQFFGGGGAQGGGGDIYQITVQAIDTQTGAQFLKNNASTIINALSLAKRNGNQAFNPQPS